MQIAALTLTSLALGLASQPGDVQRAQDVTFRYQYLAGGVNTGGGWSTWNEDGTFVSRYVAESRAAGKVPVLTYYQLLQSRPAAGDGEAAQDLSNLRNVATMRAYWRDLRLAMRRARGSTPVVLHVEPDLWGYIQQAGHPRRVPAAVRSTRIKALRGLPDSAVGFARGIERLRDRTARNVVLAFHLSTWGTREDPTYSKPSLAHMDRLAARSARFYKRLRTRFDLVFNDVADRDAGFREHVLGDGGASRWSADDFHRHAAYIRGFTRRTKRPVAIWQIPLGNSSLPDEWGRYSDTRAEWWLGPDRESHLREAVDAGIVALLFGAGADGNTDETTDGGYFLERARAYARDPFPLP